MNYTVSVILHGVFCQYVLVMFGIDLLKCCALSIGADMGKIYSYYL